MSARTDTARSTRGVVWPLVANLVAVVPLLVAYALHESNRDAYYQAVQEDQLLEWATVWAFAVAAVIFAVAAIRQRQASGVLPWFLAGVSLFCLFVAGEEISWGQRVLGYRPPTYFLQENFQQELNIHNVVDTSLRKMALKGVILGYGLLLPLLELAPAVRRLCERLAVVAPPWQLAPAFLVAFFTYQQYPLKFTGEVVELMVGLAFLFAALAAAETFAGRPETGPRRLGRLVLVLAIVAALGLSAAAYSRRQRGTGEEILAAVATETAALKVDFLTMARDNRGKAVTRCGLHKRVYSFVEKYDTDYLYQGAFAALTGQGMPTERAEFFLDPWNSPYWIRDECSRSKGRRVIFVYSFGPNRKRESTEWEIQGDDLGAVIFQLAR
jgi:hypothetical protein